MGNFPPVLSFQQHLRTVVGFLLEAREMARDAGCDPWTFALETAQLRDYGIRDNLWKWLTLKGYVEHRHAGRRTAGQPSKVDQAPLALTKQSSFVLTEAGDQFARQLLGQSCQEYTIQGLLSAGEVLGESNPSSARTQNRRQEKPSRLPHWDDLYKELWFEDQLVKRFRLPSPNQETVLAAFQEDDWVARIDDPLPPSPRQTPQTRLGNTIKALNRNQKVKLLRFRGDGTGQGVFWEPLSETEISVA